MNKKILSMCIAVIFVFQVFTVVAESTITANFDVSVSDTVKQQINIKGTVSGDTIHENRLLTLLAVGKDSEITDELYALSYAEITDDNTFEVTTGFSHPTGEYDFYAIYENTKHKVTYKYISPDDLIEAIKKIGNNTVAEEQIYETLKAVENGIERSLSSFGTELGEKVLEYRINLNRQKLNTNDKVQAINNLNELLTLCEGEYAFLIGLHSITYSGSYYQYLYNNTLYTNIDFTKYGTLTPAQKSWVTDSFLNKKFNNADEVKAYFDEIVLSAPQNVVTTPSVGGGGGGGATGPVVVTNDRYFETEVEDKTQTGKFMKFRDIADVQWAYAAIENLYEAGIVNGVTEDRFNPNGLVTREEFAKLLAVTLNIYDANNKSTFDDVKDEWYAPYVASVEKTGIIKGIGNNLFGVGNSITRQDMAVMLYNALAYKNNILKEEKVDFNDFDEINDYAKEAVKRLAGAKIINGMADGSFAPYENATRAQAAVLINALKERIEQ